MQLSWEAKILEELRPVVKIAVRKVEAWIRVQTIEIETGCPAVEDSSLTNGGHGKAMLLRSIEDLSFVRDEKERLIFFDWPAKDKTTLGQRHRVFATTLIGDSQGGSVQQHCLVNSSAP